MSRRRTFDTIDHRVPDADRAPTLHLKCARHPHDIDRISAAAGALAADRAIAALVGVGGVAVEREFDRAAAARAFQTHRHSSLRYQSAAFAAPVTATRLPALCERICAGGPAGRRAGQIRDSRAWGNNQAPGTKTSRATP